MKGKWQAFALLASFVLMWSPVALQYYLEKEADRTTATGIAVSFHLRSSTSMDVHLANGAKINYDQEDLDNKRVPKLGDEVKYRAFTKEAQEKIDKWAIWLVVIGVVFGILFVVLLCGWIGDAVVN